MLLRRIWVSVMLGWVLRGSNKALLARNSNMIMSSTVIHPIAENAWCRSGIVDASSRLILALVVYVFDVEGVDMSWEKAEECETYVDEEVGAAAGNKSDTYGWEEESDDYEKNCGDHSVDFAVCID